MVKLAVYCNALGFAPKTVAKQVSGGVSPLLTLGQLPQPRDPLARRLDASLRRRVARRRGARHGPVQDTPPAAPVPAFPATGSSPPHRPDRPASLASCVYDFHPLPVIDGKEATFWHFISEGDDEAERLPDLRRCERIRWPRPVIEAADSPDVKVWREARAGETRIHLWVESAEYLVVLAERRGYLLPWTAYPVVRDHSKANLRKRWERYR